MLVSLVWQEDFLECKRQRLEGLLAAAGLALKMLAVDKGLLSPVGGCWLLGRNVAAVIVLCVSSRIAAAIGVILPCAKHRFVAFAALKGFPGVWFACCACVCSSLVPSRPAFCD